MKTEFVWLCLTQIPEALHTLHANKGHWVFTKKEYDKCHVHDGLVFNWLQSAQIFAL